MAIKKDDINILDLPVVENVAAGDYLVLETPDGTSIIDYENFIIGPENTTLSVTVSAISNDVVAINENLLSTIDTLSTQIYDSFKQVYIGTAYITIDSGHTATSYLDPIPPKELEFLEDKDFIIMPANQTACLYPCYITDIINSDAGWGTFSVYAPFKRSNSVVQGDVNSKLTSKGLSIEQSGIGIQTMGGLVTAFSWAGFEDALKTFIVNNYTTTSQSVQQDNPLSISQVDTEFTADVLDEKPSYIVKVVKTY
jgi:hypothetical protein